MRLGEFFFQKGGIKAKYHLKNLEKGGNFLKKGEFKAKCHKKIWKKGEINQNWGKFPQLGEISEPWSSVIKKDFKVHLGQTVAFLKAQTLPNTDQKENP